jgi:hypothetical protein
MKVFSKLLILTLVLSVFTFVACGDDNKENPPVDENLPIADVKGTYKGTITIPSGVDTIPATTVPDVPITIAPPSASDSAVLSIPAGKIINSLPAINASCKVTSDKEKYSLTGTATVLLPLSDTVSIPIPVEVKNSSITKAGDANFNIEVKLPAEVPPGITLQVKFEGKKQ